jgi:hypothetical protein
MHIYIPSKSSHGSVLHIVIFLRSFSENNCLSLSQDPCKFANKTRIFHAFFSLLEILRPKCCVYFLFLWHLPIRIKLYHGVPSILHFVQRKYCTCLSSIEFLFFFLTFADQTIILIVHIFKRFRYMLDRNHTHQHIVGSVVENRRLGWSHNGTVCCSNTWHSAALCGNNT